MARNAASSEGDAHPTRREGVPDEGEGHPK
jgi:hypothetical protein